MLTEIRRIEIVTDVAENQVIADAVAKCVDNMLQTMLDAAPQDMRDRLGRRLKALVVRVAEKVMTDIESFPPVPTSHRWKISLQEDTAPWVIGNEAFWTAGVPELCNEFERVARMQRLFPVPSLCGCRGSYMLPYGPRASVPSVAASSQCC